MLRFLYLIRKIIYSIIFNDVFLDLSILIIQSLSISYKTSFSFAMSIKASNLFPLNVPDKLTKSTHKIYVYLFIYLKKKIFL